MDKKVNIQPFGDAEYARQGDVVVRRRRDLETVEGGLTGEITLALGEATGHMHVIKTPTKHKVSKNSILFEVSASAPTTIEHVKGNVPTSDHDYMLIPDPGVYESWLEREDDPVAGVRKQLD